MLHVVHARFFVVAIGGFLPQRFRQRLEALREWPDIDNDRRSENTLNGIAYATDSGHFYLTGKDWPTMYEVTFVPVD